LKPASRCEGVLRRPAEKASNFRKCELGRQEKEVLMLDLADSARQRPGRERVRYKLARTRG
jgi:hypothetical protein